METNKLANFIYLITDTPEEDLDQLKTELRDAGIEPDDIPEIISETIRKSKAEFRIHIGKRFKANFIKNISESGLLLMNQGLAEKKPGLAVAYRNKKTGEKDSPEIDSLKLDMIRKAKEESRDCL